MEKKIKLPTRLLFIGIILHLILFTSIVIFGFMNPASWLTLGAVSIFYYPLVFLLNLFANNPKGLIVILYFYTGGAVLYGMFFWLLGVLINKYLTRPKVKEQFK